MSILGMTALELGKRVQSGDTTTVQIAEASPARIGTVEPSIHAYVTVNEEKTTEQAREIQAEIKAGRPSGPLAGVPVVIRDNMCIEGMRTTYSFGTLENFIPTYMARTVANLEQAGAVILGKTDVDEFAMGSTTETSVFDVTKNPWNLEHTPGRSSGGSCAAVVARECFYTLGSDTDGSIRQSSSSCGVMGIKPTYGTVSRYGLIAYGLSLGQIGPVAKDMPDCAAVLGVLISHDPKGNTSMKWSDRNFTAVLSGDVRGMRIGISESRFGQGLDQEVKDAVLETVRVLGEKGTIVEIFDLKLVEYVIPAYYVVISVEASSNLSHFDGVKYGYRAPEYEGLHGMYRRNRPQGFGPEMKRRIMLGSSVLNSGYHDTYYLKALRIKVLTEKGFDRAFMSHDVIPALAAPAIAP